MHTATLPNMLQDMSPLNIPFPPKKFFGRWRRLPLLHHTDIRIDSLDHSIVQLFTDIYDLSLIHAYCRRFDPDFLEERRQGLDT